MKEAKTFFLGPQDYKTIMDCMKISIASLEKLVQTTSDNLSLKCKEDISIISQTKKNLEEQFDRHFGIQ